MDEEGFGPRVTTPRAAAVARELANDDVDALWRAPGDATIDVVRESRGHVEHHRIDADGAATLVEVTAFRMSTFLSRGSAVRNYVRAHFGGDEGWAPVPREAKMDGANGEQQVTAAALTHAANKKSMVCVRPEGVVEIALKGSGGTEVHTIDRRGHPELMRVVRRRHSRLVFVASLLIAVASFVLAIGAGRDILAVPFWLACAAFAFVAIATHYSPSEAIPPGDSATWKELRTDEPNGGD